MSGMLCLARNRALRLLALLLIICGVPLLMAQVPRPPAGAATTLPSLTLTGSTGTILAVDSPTLVVDATNNRVGVGTATPSAALDVIAAITNPSGFTNAFEAYSTLVATSAHTAQQHITGSIGVDIGASNTKNWTSTDGQVGLYTFGYVEAGATGTLANIIGALYGVSSDAVGAVVTTAYGLREAPNAFAGSVGTQVGVAISNHTSGTNNTNLFIGSGASGASPTPPSGNYSIYSASTYASSLAGTLTATQFMGVAPTAEAITAGATVTASACGGIKQLTSASALTTGTTNSITAPAAANLGCRMSMCNMNAANAITIDKNANILLAGGADVVLGAGCCIDVISTGASGVWKQVTAQLCSS